jgi:hypothetical protein
MPVPGLGLLLSAKTGFFLREGSDWRRLEFEAPQVRAVAALGGELGYLAGTQGGLGVQFFPDKPACPTFALARGSIRELAQVGSRIVAVARGGAVVTVEPKSR